MIGAFEWVLLVFATFAGALIQAATGFGFAIVAAPFFLAAIDSTVAVPLLVMLHIVQSAMLVPRIWLEIPGRHLRALLIGAAVGCPAGLVLFLAADVRSLKLLAGIVILAASLLLLIRQKRKVFTTGAPSGPISQPRDLPLIVTGAVSGAMTALLVMPGPPLMIWLMGAHLPAVATRALSLSFFAACYVVVGVLSIAAGQLGPAEWGMAAVLSPLVVAGTIGGARLAGRMGEARFRTVLLVLLILSGLGALLSVWI